MEKWQKAKYLGTEIAGIEELGTLNRGGNISAVFRKLLPQKYNGFKVVNADDSDLRFLDGDNIIAGLLAKGKAKNDYSGFVLDS